MQPSEIQTFRRILGALVGGQGQLLWKRDEIAVDKSPNIIDQGQSATELTWPCNTSRIVNAAVRRLEPPSRELRRARTALARTSRIVKEVKWRGVRLPWPTSKQTLLEIDPAVVGVPTERFHQDSLIQA